MATVSSSKMHFQLSTSIKTNFVTNNSTALVKPTVLSRNTVLEACTFPVNYNITIEKPIKCRIKSKHGYITQVGLHVYPTIFEKYSVNGRSRLMNKTTVLQS